MKKPPQRNIPLAQQAHQKLEELIVTLELAPGTMWTEQSLSDLIGIGRTPIREALKRLDAGRLIETVPRHGVRISEINLYEQLQIVEFRLQLEHLISGWAARRALPQEKAHLIEMALSFEDAAERNDYHSYLRTVIMANGFIAECARNPFVAMAIAPLLGLSSRFYYKYHEQLNNLEYVSGLHAARARAIAMGDSAAAEAAADVLTRAIEEFTRTIFLRDVGRAET